MIAIFRRAKIMLFWRTGRLLTRLLGTSDGNFIITFRLLLMVYIRKAREVPNGIPLLFVIYTNQILVLIACNVLIYNRMLIGKLCCYIENTIICCLFCESVVKIQFVNKLSDSHIRPCYPILPQYGAIGCTWPCGRYGSENRF